MSPWIPLEPALRGREAATFVEYAKTISRPQGKRRSGAAASAVLTAAQLVLQDLVLRQGWRMRVRKGVVEVAQPGKVSVVEAEKLRVRQQLHAERDEQLRNDAVRSFVRSMEVRHIHRGRAVSIFSLMRDGTDLADRITEALRATGDEARERALRSIVRPYLQFVTDNAECEWTGFRLQDIWRYFRHTWASPYRSTPGRSMMILVRDAAVEPHPVIGIAMLGSAAVQIGVRDRWIGWFPDDVVESMATKPTREAAKWLQRTVDEGLAELFVDDLLEDKVITRALLKKPKLETIGVLFKEAERQRELHQRFTAAADYKRPREPDEPDDAYWEKAARGHLFRSKRSELLATLLRARLALGSGKEKKLTAAALGSLLETSDGRRTVRSIIKRAKAERVGTNMAEITVCGAVAPYNVLLGGKLVSMLLSSPEVNAAYRSRYRNNCSVIASSMAGRSVVRPAELVLLCTTSLYGAGSSQYNRLRMPCGAVGGQAGDEIRYEELGKTAGYGTLHFGMETVDALSVVASQREDGQRINSIFGEGVSPRLRKAREGLDALDFPSEMLLNHGSPRVVYGIPLARNFREYLLGKARAPDYLITQSSPRERTDAIVEWWSTRWMRARCERPETLTALRQQRLVHPIRHAARVVLPKIETDQLSFAVEL